MPVVGIPVKKLSELLTKEISKTELLETLEKLGCDVEGYTTYKRYSCTLCGGIIEVTETEDDPALCTTCGNDFRERPDTQRFLELVEVIRMELLAVRPDMFDPGGLARVLRGYFDLDTGLAKYDLTPPQLEVTVDPNLSSPDSYRPYIACAVLKNVRLDTEFIRIIMKLQENLHWAVGRNRKHASIGIYDLNTVTGNFRYGAMDPDTTRFNPLGAGVSRATDPPSARAILETHPKGTEFKYLLDGFARYPILIDAQNRILSMPPIINSDETKVTPGTSTFFIDVTGTGERIVNKTLNVLTTSLLEIDHGLELEQVKINYPDGSTITPDFTPEDRWISWKNAELTLGVELTMEDTIRHLLRMRHGVLNTENDRIQIQIAPYRNDILHECDIIEDIGVSYGYHNIPWNLVKNMTVGQELPVETRSRIARNVLTGLGYMEVLNITLTSQKRNFDDLRIEREDDIVILSNPVSPQMTMLRTHLLPGILETFENNREYELPQKIFEIGDISLLDKSAETGAVEHRKIAGAAIGSKIGYSDIRSIVERLLHEYKLPLVVKPFNHPTCISGRSAQICININNENRVLGFMGEIHPEVLANFSLIYPVAAFEINLP